MSPALFLCLVVGATVIAALTGCGVGLVLAASVRWVRQRRRASRLELLRAVLEDR